MSNAITKISLGTGIYNVSSLAFILRLPRRKARRRFNEFWEGRLTREQNRKVHRQKAGTIATNFWTLIEFFVYYQLREAKLGIPAILKAHSIIGEQLRTCYPFAHSRLLLDGKSILHYLDDNNVLKSDKNRLRLFTESIRSFAMKIDFTDDMLADRLYPLGRRHKIVVDPHHQFGQPVVVNTNLRAETLYSHYYAGDTPGMLIRMFDISIEELNDAIAFFTLYDPLAD